jgi:predicted dehydrogenase
MSQAIRVGVLGAGAVASSVHLPILRRRSDLFDLRAIADFNQEAASALAERFAIEHIVPTQNRCTSPARLMQLLS